MEQDVEDQKFEHMMDEIINELISYAFGVDNQRTIKEAIDFLSTTLPQDAMISINDKLDNEAKGRLRDTFGEEYEIGAIEIMMQICTKILSMRKLVLEYPMIFVPLSFEKYQPRFMTKKSQRRHKLKRQMRKRQHTLDPQMANKIMHQHRKSGSRHKQNKISLNESINNTNINKIVMNANEDEDEESLSDLSDGGDNESLRDENLNQRLKNIKQYGMKSKTSVNVKSDDDDEEEDKNDHMDPNDDTDNDDNRVIDRAKSTPSDMSGGSRKMMKHKTLPKRSKTRSSVFPSYTMQVLSCGH